MMIACSSALHSIRERIAASAMSARRSPADVKLIAVSKTRSVNDIAPLLDAGQRDFGENRVSEALEKWTPIKAFSPDVRLHLIGQLQSNKADQAVTVFDAIHSVDRPSLVAALASAQKAHGRRPEIFLQVNVGNEAQKGGCPIGDLPELLLMAQSAGLDVRGLMSIPPAALEPAPFFALLAKLAHDHALFALSMGMSGDFESAIRLGATHVRIGSALFGERTA